MLYLYVQLEDEKAWRFAALSSGEPRTFSKRKKAHNFLRGRDTQVQDYEISPNPPALRKVKHKAWRTR